MKIFISWSGAKSKIIAQALREWLPLILQYVKPWLSESDIVAGERWEQSVAKELSSSYFGIICVTPDNINSPWLLFEAGALAKSLEKSRVIPLLHDLEFSDISGPLAQFQAKKMNQDGFVEIIKSIQENAELPIPELNALQLFKTLWPEIEKKLKKIPVVKKSQKRSRPESEILEELVLSVRSLDSRIKGLELDIGNIDYQSDSEFVRLNEVYDEIKNQFVNDSFSLSVYNFLIDVYKNIDPVAAMSVISLRNDIKFNKKPTKKSLRGFLSELINMHYKKHNISSLRYLINVIENYMKAYLDDVKITDDHRSKKTLAKSDAKDDIDGTS